MTEPIRTKKIDFNISTSQRLAHLLRDEAQINHGNRILLIHDNGSQELLNSPPNDVNVFFHGKNSLLVMHEQHQIKKVNLHMGESCYAYFGKGFQVRFLLNINLNHKRREGPSSIRLRPRRCSGSRRSGDRNGKPSVSA